MCLFFIRHNFSRKCMQLPTFNCICNVNIFNETETKFKQANNYNNNNNEIIWLFRKGIINVVDLPFIF